MWHFKALIAACLAGGFISGAGPAKADTHPVLVELFTSQGCSACPPADAYMHDLIQRDDVIALALHVDYWDYIGWKDIFAKPAFTARQKAYAKAGGRRSIYTPQMVIAGKDHVAGTHRDDAAILIQRHGMRDTGVTLSAKRDKGVITIQAKADKAGDAPLEIFLVRYIPQETVEITRGENAGHKVDYVNIVTDWSRIGTWDMNSPLTFEYRIEGEAPGVVVLQDADHGPVMAAAHLR